MADKHDVFPAGSILHMRRRDVIPFARAMRHRRAAIGVRNIRCVIPRRLWLHISREQMPPNKSRRINRREMMPRAAIGFAVFNQNIGAAFDAHAVALAAAILELAGGFIDDEVAKDEVILSIAEEDVAAHAGGVNLAIRARVGRRGDCECAGVPICWNKDVIDERSVGIGRDLGAVFPIASGNKIAIGQKIAPPELWLGSVAIGVIDNRARPLCRQSSARAIRAIRPPRMNRIESPPTKMAESTL